MDWNNIFIYKDDDGSLYWKNPFRKRKPHLPVGTKDAYGYLIIWCGDRLHKVHRIIWEMHNGRIPSGCVIDHIDRDVSNNCIENLRIATKSQNALNSKVRNDNTTGFVGVSLKKGRDKYRAYISIDGKRIELGNYSTLDQAVSARKKEEARLGLL